MTSHVRECWSGFGAWKFHASQIYLVVGLAIAPMIVAALAQSVGRPPRVALYASVGEEPVGMAGAIQFYERARTEEAEMVKGLRDQFLSCRRFTHK